MAFEENVLEILPYILVIPFEVYQSHKSCLLSLECLECEVQKCFYSIPFHRVVYYFFEEKGKPVAIILNRF